MLAVTTLLCLRSDIVIFGQINRFLLLTYLLTYIISPRRSLSRASYSHRTLCRSVCVQLQCIVVKQRIGSGYRLAS